MKQRAKFAQRFHDDSRDSRVASHFNLAHRILFKHESLYCPAGSETHLAAGRCHCHHLSPRPLLFPPLKRYTLAQTPNSFEAHTNHTLTHESTHTRESHASRSSFSPFSSHSLTSPSIVPVFLSSQRLFAPAKSNNARAFFLYLFTTIRSAAIR